MVINLWYDDKHRKGVITLNLWLRRKPGIWSNNATMKKRRIWGDLRYIVVTIKVQLKFKGKTV